MKRYFRDKTTGFPRQNIIAKIHLIPNVIAISKAEAKPT